MISKHLKYLWLLWTVLFLSTTVLQAQGTSDIKPQVGTIPKIGNVILFVLQLFTLETLFIIGNENGTWHFTNGILTKARVTYGLKKNIDKQKLDLSNNKSFSSRHAYPTLHSTGYIHRQYGFKYSIPAYVLAGFTAVSRIGSKKYDTLDVLAYSIEYGEAYKNLKKAFREFLMILVFGILLAFIVFLFLFRKIKIALCIIIITILGVAGSLLSISFERKVFELG